jgi:hypothetical protein
MSRTHVACAALLSAAVLTACGGSPTSSSGAVVLRGTVVGEARASALDSAASASAARSSARAAGITVTVQEDPSITTTVGGDGTFELSGLPAGDFTLVFTSDGVVLGAIEITGVVAGEVIRITVQVTTTTVILIDIVNGDGDDDDGDGEDEDGDEDDGDEDGDRTCAISGGKVGQQIQLEGHVADGDASGFEMRVNGNRVKNGARVDVTTSGASFKCTGKPTATECRSTIDEGAKVHVSGILNACDMASATVAAREVKVQKP